jgi:CBS domain-containing protein
VTYVPKTIQAETPITQALRIMEERMSQYGIHTVYEGRNLVGGVDKGAAVVCVVEEKGPRAQSTPIPAYIETETGHQIPTDVVANPRPHDLRLRLPEIQSQNDHQRCHNCPIPGGVQIAPQGAPWVGTLGAALKLGDKYGALTNAHVSGLRGEGTPCCQPSGRSGQIGVFSKVVGMRFDGGANYIDAAIIDTLLTSGPFSPQTHTVVPSQFGLGRINPQPKPAAVGDVVRKTGRTTGITTGRIVGINATSRVGYDEGQATFRNQIVIEANSGTFSAGGDSGSLIVSQDLRPVALLFAGGGGQTIANPIEYVLDWAGATFF